MHVVETIIGWSIGALVFVVTEMLAFAMSVADTVTGWGAPGGVTFLVASTAVVFACLVFRHRGPSLLASMGLWLAWRYVLAAQAATDWIIARIEARRWRQGAHSEWTSDRRTGEADADGATIEDEVFGEQIAEQARGREHEHHLVRAMRKSREWEMLNSVAKDKTSRKVAFRRLAQRFHPDRAKPEDKEAALPHRHRTPQRPDRYSRNHGNRRVVLPILSA